MKLLDTSCLSLFIIEVPEYDFINELNDLNESLNTTKHVEKEFNMLSSELNNFIVNRVVNVENIDYDLNLKKRFPSLGSGELSIIQWGLNLKGNEDTYYCVLDDLKARKSAKKLGLPIMGSVGLIKIVIDIVS